MIEAKLLSMIVSDDINQSLFHVHIQILIVYDLIFVYVSLLTLPLLSFLVSRKDVNFTCMCL
jgi:uncharacterized membrane protein